MGGKRLYSDTLSLDYDSFRLIILSIAMSDERKQSRYNTMVFMNDNRFRPSRLSHRDTEKHCHPDQSDHHHQPSTHRMFPSLASNLGTDIAISKMYCKDPNTVAKSPRMILNGLLALRIPSCVIVTKM
jgi:hypothetical protein